jgi:enamine deaminase RidA (YjgF/YER057c/UK114 family)
MKLATILMLGAIFAGPLALNPNAAGADVVRYPVPNSTFPIAQSVQVSGNAATYYVSGQVPSVVNKEVEPNSPQAYGDTKTKTIAVLSKIKRILEGLGLGMGDVVKMQVFLVHDVRAPTDLPGPIPCRRTGYLNEFSLAGSIFSTSQSRSSPNTD